MVYFGPKLCVMGNRPAGYLERRERKLLETESIVDHDEKHNAQKNEEDEAAIKNNDGSVDKHEVEIKEVNVKVVVNSYS